MGFDIDVCSEDSIAISVLNKLVKKYEPDILKSQEYARGMLLGVESIDYVIELEPQEVIGLGIYTIVVSYLLKSHKKIGKHWKCKEVYCDIGFLAKTNVLEYAHTAATIYGYSLKYHVISYNTLGTLKISSLVWLPTLLDNIDFVRSDKQIILKNSKFFMKETLDSFEKSYNRLSDMLLDINIVHCGRVYVTLNISKYGEKLLDEDTTYSDFIPLFYEYLLNLFEKDCFGINELHISLYISPTDILRKRQFNVLYFGIINMLRAKKESLLQYKVDRKVYLYLNYTDTMFKECKMDIKDMIEIYTEYEKKLNLYVRGVYAPNKSVSMKELLDSWEFNKEDLCESVEAVVVE